MSYFKTIRLMDSTETYYLNIDSNGKIISKSEQSGTWDIQNINGTISLPTGAATETTLLSINSKDFATETTLNTLGTEATLSSLDSKDFATETTLTTLSTEATLSAFKIENNTNLNDIETDIEITNTKLSDIYTRQSNKTQFTKLTDGTNDVEVTSDNRLKVESVQANGATQNVVITDKDDPSVQASVNASGQLQVSTPPPQPPEGTTGISRTEYNSVSGTSDNVFTIPNGETLIIQRLSASAEGTAAIELWYDPNGNGNSMTILAVIFSNANTSQIDLNSSYTGNGTRAIRLRRSVSGWGSQDIFARWEGYY